MASLEVDRVALAALCRRHQIRRISLFGSTLKRLGALSVPVLGQTLAVRREMFAV